MTRAEESIARFERLLKNMSDTWTVVDVDVEELRQLVLELKHSEEKLSLLTETVSKMCYVTFYHGAAVAQCDDGWWVVLDNDGHPRFDAPSEKFIRCTSLTSAHHIAQKLMEDDASAATEGTS